MSIFDRGAEDPQNMEYMHEVDVALHRPGHPLAFTLSIATLVFFLAFLIWASFATIDDVVRGSGKVAPMQGVHNIQSERGGTITRILVREGDVVEANQEVALVRNIQEASVLRELQVKSVELSLARERLEAEARGEAPAFAEEMVNQYPQAVQAQMNIYNSRRLQFAGEDQQLRSQIEQRRRDQDQFTERRTQLASSLQLLEKEEATVRPMRGRSYSEIAYLELQQRIVTLRGDLESATISIRRAQEEIDAAEARLRLRKAERLASIVSESNKNRVELEAIAERIKSWDDQVSSTTLRAPVRGTVKDILFKEGSVARPAEVIMEILPSEGSLEIVARFHPQDRGFLYVDQKGIAKFTTYNFAQHGGLEATVDRISEDSIEDRRGDPWYEVHLTTQGNVLHSQGMELPILPGMEVSIDLLTDKRTVLSFLLSPLRRAKQSAMTEH